MPRRPEIAISDADQQKRILRVNRSGIGSTADDKIRRRINGASHWISFNFSSLFVAHREGYSALR